MHPLVARLDRWLQAYRPDYRAGLAPGASAADIDEIARRVDGELPALLRDLLTWCDGQRADNFGSLEFYWALMSAREIASTLDDMAWFVGQHDIDGFWGPGWVPFLANGFGDYVCIDLEGGFGGIPGQILEHSHEDPVRYITHPSLEAWLETLVVAVESGMFGDDHDGRWDPVDDEAYAALRAERHPGYPVTARIPDSSEDPGRTATAGFRQPAHAGDHGGLRATLRTLGVDDAVIEAALDRMPDAHDHGEN